MSTHFYHSPASSYFVGLAFGLDSLNLKTSQINVPETTAPITKATVINLKNRFQISTRLSRYSPGSSPAANTYCTVGTTNKIVNMHNDPNIFLITSCSVVTFKLYLRVLRIFSFNKSFCIHYINCRN